MAMNNLGVCYEEGKGVLKDTGIALEWYKKASSLGNAHAMNNLGFFKVMQHEFEFALELLQQAANTGSIDALYNIALVYEKGYGVPISVETAFKYYIKAADLVTISSLISCLIEPCSCHCKSGRYLLSRL